MYDYCCVKQIKPKLTIQCKSSFSIGISSTSDVMMMLWKRYIHCSYPMSDSTLSVFNSLHDVIIHVSNPYLILSLNLH